MRKSATVDDRGFHFRRNRAILSLAPWWRRRHDFATLSRGAAMLAFGIMFNLIGLGFFCWLLFALAAHALPAFVGVTAFLAAIHSGAGPFGAMLVGLVSGSAALLAGRLAFAATASPLFRAAIATFFAAPAAIAGYHVALGLAIGVTSAVWREAFSLIGAVMVGRTAWTSVTLYSSPVPGQVLAARRSPLRFGRATDE